jgi:hypothetical protein
VSNLLSHTLNFLEITFANAWIKKTLPVFYFCRFVELALGKEALLYLCNLSEDFTQPLFEKCTGITTFAPGMAAVRGNWEAGGAM